MDANELITTINTIIKLYTDREIEIKVEKQKNDFLSKEIELLKKQLEEKEEELKKIYKSKKEVKEILEEIQKEGKA